MSLTSPELATRGASILIVDDEPFVCEIVSRWLDAEGYNCRVATSAEEAWQMVQTGGFDLLVLDINMPGESGVELLARARQRFPDVAAIMLTAVDDREVAIRTLQLGAYGYVIKPFERNELVIHVVGALERRRLELMSKDYERRLEEKIREQTQHIRHSREQIVLRLMAAQQFRHDETGGHVRRMGLYAEALGQALGQPPEYTDVLRLAAPMHDVGKIGIPDSVLMKPGPLTPEETETMKAHTTIGARILEGTGIPLLDVARDIALCHHEHWDGSGYPRGLAGKDIPQPARIVAVLDVYDALVHDRAYRPAMPEQEALELMAEGKGSRFDPELYELFLDALPRLREIRSEVPDERHPGAPAPA